MGPNDALLCVAIAFACAAAACVARLRASLGPDEAYLWYGVQRLLAGQLPHRDFRSYEPGRYLWSAPFLWWGGGGLAALRAATHGAFGLGLSAALIALRHLGESWATVGIAAAVLTLWAQPQHKQFEVGFVLAAWSVSVHLLVAPAVGSAVMAGAIAGLGVGLGLNLFLYSLASGLALAACVGAGGWLAEGGALAAWAVAGLAIGAAPWLVPLLDRGFARRFMERRFVGILRRGATNLPLPRPWPWREPTADWRRFLGSSLRALFFRWLFLGLMTLPAVVLVLGALRPDLLGGPASGRGVGLVAAAAVGLGFAHHASGRADPPHLTQVVAPLVLLGILSAPPGLPTAAILVGLSAWATRPFWKRRGSTWLRVGPTGFRIRADPHEARLHGVVGELRPTGDPGSFLFAAPALPSLFASHGLESPVYDTFPLYPATEAAQREMIHGIEAGGVTVAIVDDAPFDGREELRFSRTHPLVWAHLLARFEWRSDPELGSEIRVLVRRRGPASTG